MMSRFVVLVVLISAVNQGMAECQDKPPMANYTADLVPGKFYLIISKPGVNHQYSKLRCGTSYIESAATTNFTFYMSCQESNENVSNSSANMTNISPPGTWLVSSVDGIFHVSVIGSIKGKVNIYYACRAKYCEEAVWVYYYKRVNGVNEIDDATRQYILDILDKNQISRHGFRTVNNKKCLN